VPLGVSQLTTFMIFKMDWTAKLPLELQLVLNVLQDTSITNRVALCVRDAQAGSLLPRVLRTATTFAEVLSLKISIRAFVASAHFTGLVSPWTALFFLRRPKGFGPQREQSTTLRVNRLKALHIPASALPVAALLTLLLICRYVGQHQTFLTARKLDFMNN
jgi:hypothetical protein